MNSRRWAAQSQVSVQLQYPHFRRREPVAVAKMFTYISGRYRLKSSDDSTSTPGVRANSVLCSRTLRLFQRHREQSGDGVKLRPRKAADPVVRMVRADVTDHLPPGRHALPEFLWKCRE